MALPRLTQVKSEFSVGSSIGTVIVWMLLTLITLGIAAFFFPYFYQKDVLNRSFVVDGTGTKMGRLRCSIGFGDAFGHAFLWILLTIITLGLALFIYQIRVTRFVYNHTEIEWLD
ncbi:DUF6693 family protein [Henriciella sp.]|uniref:DUF6693 family protein n=1 Tax=Henriciella sp. TaxID=1968823 RepID=UPI00261D8C9D|nr:DUF6693 family protein [Henriciella sp.]